MALVPRRRQVVIAADALVLVDEAIVHLMCGGCFDERLLERSDPRATARPTPRCERCGDWMLAVNGPAPTYRCGCDHCRRVLEVQ